MKRKNWIRFSIFVFLLPALFACGAIPGRSDATGTETETDASSVGQTESESPAELRWPELLDGKRPKYSIITPDNGNLTTTMAMAAISTQLKEIAGTTFSTGTDLVGWQGMPDRYEIVIGNTNREETAQVMGELSEENPYAVREVGKRIVIAGINDEYLAMAARQFLLEYTGADIVIDYVPGETSATAIPAPVNSATVPSTPAPSLADQTGHPEVSAKQADVEQLLAVSPNYDYTHDYQIGFRGTPVTVAIPEKTEATRILSEYDTLYDIVADVNVRDFGAMGDGKHDDTPAFHAAIAAVESMGGGTVFVPKGYYCLTESLTLPALVTLAGELKPGTAEGSVLCIYGGKGETDRAKAAIICGPHASVQNLAFWYPEQTVVNGRAIPYPAAINQNYINGLTVRNVTFVNAYRGIDAAQDGAVYALEYMRDIHGTCLDFGFYNDFNLDIGKLENFHLSPNYWLESGLPGTPNEQLLRTYMIRNSVGVHMGQADFFYFSDIHIEGYLKGLYFARTTTRPDSNAVSNGQILNPVLVDCYYPIYINDVSWFKVTGGELRAVGNKGATAIFYESGVAATSGAHQSGTLYFTNTKINSAGCSAVINNAIAPKTLFYGCTVTSAIGSAVAARTDVSYQFVNTSVESGNGRVYETYTDDTLEHPEDIDTAAFAKVTKPASDRFIDLSAAPYHAKAGEDISAVLQQAIDDLRESGGMVYIPAGAYYVNSHIDLWAGVELRGASVTAHVDIFFTPVKAGESWSEGGTNPYRESGTVLYTNFGKNDPDGREWLSMHEGSGLVGLSVEYHEQNSRAIDPYSFTVRGYGKDIYIIDVGMSSTYNGIDFATNRCDGHYVEFLWSVGLNTGIRVGSGSQGGIIRDCHYTVNCWQIGRYRDTKYWDNIEKVATATGHTYVIENSEGEVLYNNFAINQVYGISLLDGAQNVLSVGTAIDYSDVDVYLSGNATATVVNGQFVSARSGSNSPLHMSTVYTAPDFTGKVNLFNCAHWGKCIYAYNLNGAGEVFSALSHADSNKDENAFANVIRGKATFVTPFSTRKALIFKGADTVESLRLVRCVAAKSMSVDKKIPKEAVTVD